MAGTRNEEQRLAALRSYEVLDSAPEPEFDEITRNIAEICDAPIAVVSLLDEKRQWFKSRYGIDVQQTPRDLAFCNHTIKQDDIFEVPDATQDQRFASHPMVVGEGGLRFYAGAPLHSSDGHNIGTLCVMDRKPRALTEPQGHCLKALAKQAMIQLELRRALLEKNRALAAKDILLKEVNHRVKNGLQMIGSLMQLQKRKITDPVAQQQIADMGTRIQTLATVHRHLYRQNDLVRAELDAYLREVCKPLAQSADVTIEIDAPAALLPIDALVPLAMVINELVTNASKYARRPGARPTVRITGSIGPAESADEAAEGVHHLHLNVCDDGPGLPEGFDIENTSGLGMRVVHSLVAQLDGTISARNTPGACFDLDVKMKSVARADAA